MATSQDFVAWTCSEALLPQYLMYALMAEGRGIRRFGRGSTHTTIYMAELRAFHIALPPLQEQKEIASQVSRVLSRAAMMLKAAAYAARVADQLVPRAVAHAMVGGLEKGSRAGETAVALLDELRRDRLELPKPPQKRRAKRTKEARVEEIAVAEDAPSDHERDEDLDLADLLRSSGGQLLAAELWRRSGLEIDRFYRSLRDAVAKGAIVETDDKEVLRAG